MVSNNLKKKSQKHFKFSQTIVIMKNNLYLKPNYNSFLFLKIDWSENSHSFSVSYNTSKKKKNFQKILWILLVCTFHIHFYIHSGKIIFIKIIYSLCIIAILNNFSNTLIFLHQNSLWYQIPIVLTLQCFTIYLQYIYFYFVKEKKKHLTQEKKKISKSLHVNNTFHHQMVAWMERVHENNFNFLLARASPLPLWTRSEQDRLSRHVDAESLLSIYLVILVNFLLVANDYINRETYLYYYYQGLLVKWKNLASISINIQRKVSKEYLLKGKKENLVLNEKI